MWAIESGKKEFEFSAGSSGITSMAIDDSGKR